MSSEVDICNLALAHLGDTASLASIDPPSGSIQAEHCARFYPIARDVLLESHPWSFATRRAALVLLTETNDQWLYVYAVPNLMVKVLAVIPPEADNDYSTLSSYSTDNGDTYNADLGSQAGSYVPQPFCLETLSTGVPVILTNQEDAVLRYQVSVTDPTKFSALFKLCLSWLLASMLAGPIIKGDVGAAEGKRCYQMFQAHLNAASVTDSNQRKINANHVVSWLAGR
jgi:hypothetical protein